MNHDRIIVVGVPRCGPSEHGAQMDIETDQGERIELAMTPEAFRQWTETCVCPSNAASPTSIDEYSCTSGPDHVLMKLVANKDDASEFMLSHGDAVMLATRLLQAAKEAHDLPRQG